MIIKMSKTNEKSIIFQLKEENNKISHIKKELLRKPNGSM